MMNHRMLEQLGRTTRCTNRPNHVKSEVQPYPKSLCDHSGERVRTPSLLAHITCQIAVLTSVPASYFAGAPKYITRAGLGQGVSRTSLTNSDGLSSRLQDAARGLP